MPMSLKRPCRYPRCPALVDSGYCETHKSEARRYDRERGSAAHRGYDHRWRDYRLWFIEQARCYCGRNHTLCEECRREGRLTVTFAVDHIQPHRNDQELFWN